MSTKQRFGNFISWVFVVLFFTLGVLNMLYIHAVPGIVYSLLAILYVPATNTLLRKTFGYSIPLIVKIIVGLLILWVTLAVGELMELYESWLGI